MKQIKIMFISFLFLIFYNLISDPCTFFRDVAIKNEVYIYYINNNENIYELIRDQLKCYGLKVNKVDKLDKNNKNLHIIFDAYYVPQNYFPENYIIYQSLDFQEVPLTKNYLSKLKNAIAVWDPSWSNINRYSLLSNNYYFFDHKYIDSYILPCLSPVEFLVSYKNLLEYSNQNDTDISSHLPVIFLHSVLKNPKIIVESGVRSGESSYAFKKALDLMSSRLIGIDISEDSKDVYKKLNINNAEFKIMDDLSFAGWFKIEYKDSRADIIFIDTSHYYDHTFNELKSFLPLLSENGLLIFHDTNMCPFSNSTYFRINNTRGIGWDNKKGVVRAIKDFFHIEFNENRYGSFNFEFQGLKWSLIHYSYCNGLTLIKRVG